MDTSAANQIHFTLQGKGGVGKSLFSSVNAQFLRGKYGHVDCYDTDPVNDTFTQYKALGARRINILDDDSNINRRVFDALIEDLIAGERPAVVDNGASTFIPLMSYMVENGVVDLLHESGKTVYFHSVVTGGQQLVDTWKGLAALLEAHQAPIVVWVNEFFGAVSKEGIDFLESKLYRNNSDRFAGHVRFHRRTEDTFGEDIKQMLAQKMTFDEVQDSEEFGLMPKKRMRMVRTDLFDQIATIGY